MASAQSQFEEFHTKILMGYEDNEPLCSRRDTLKKELRDKLSKDLPGFDFFLQGSYALHTGIVPLGGNPDIDIGIIFECSPSDNDYKDPLKLKKIIKDALSTKNRTVRIKKPCVTVEYLRNEEVIYHIDLAIYSCEGGDSEKQTYLARGRDSSPADEILWEKSSARELTEKILEKYEDKADRKQYRRVIRYLKRWKDVKIGHKNAPSVGLTVGAYDLFSNNFDFTSGKPNDLLALLSLVNLLLNNWGGDERLHIYSPVEPFSDLFSRMTDTQMTDFKTKLEKLSSVLTEARDEPDTYEACKLLSSQFGDDFPIPEKKDTTKNSIPSVIPAGRSA
ncbi:nucleotidyltransferase [Pantoea agglomerans]|uniref:nucleotidyltransferase domain-containing protein n=1 Tax=Enterobacter agglomerans TaxID=549 RepID=UPI001654B90B|nr:nucleotidyltransferase [Pantoea agglomerans]